MAMSIDSFMMNNVKSLSHKLQRDEAGGILVNYDIQGGSAAFVNLKVIQTQIFVSAHGTDKSDHEKTHEICSLTCAFDFFMEQFNQLYNQDGNLVIPFRLVSTFTSIAYGSTRGVLYTKMLGTPLGNFSMPLLDLQKLPREDQIILKESFIH